MLNYSKEDLISFILTHKEKLIIDEKTKRNNIKKSKKKAMDFDK